MAKTFVMVDCIREMTARSLVSMANMDCLIIRSLGFLFVFVFVCFFYFVCFYLSFKYMFVVVFSQDIVLRLQGPYLHACVLLEKVFTST